MADQEYSSITEAIRILDFLSNTFTDGLSLPAEIWSKRQQLALTADRDRPYFPIPFKESETTVALKAIEGCLAALLADKKLGTESRTIRVNHEKTTAFMFQAYLARIGGLGKLDKNVRSLLKDTDLLQAQSDPYRRMSANLYVTADHGEYYHIHGSLEASTTLGMIGLEAFRPDLDTHEKIVDTIEGAVKKFTVSELEQLNAANKQAGIKAMKHEDFIKTPHGRAMSEVTPWTVESLETDTPPIPLPTTNDRRILSGIKVLEMCRIIAGPIITRILAEYGADVLKVTSPNLSDVPFFQVDGNMGKHATDIDLKSESGKARFAELLADVDVIVDGYRPGALDRLGYGSKFMTELAQKRGKGIVYVNENCFGYVGEWAHRPGWQQIADCVSGVAWEQGKFMGLDEPVVPPFPLSDYGTGCMGAITALTGLYHRSTRGGSWHGKVSLVQFDMLLFRAGVLPESVQEELKKQAGSLFLALKHSHSVDQISGTALQAMREEFPQFVDHPRYLDAWYSAAYKTTVSAVRPVVEIEGLDISFMRASRPNGTDSATWDFEDKDHRVEAQLAR